MAVCHACSRPLKTQSTFAETRIPDIKSHAQSVQVYIAGVQSAEGHGNSQYIPVLFKCWLWLNVVVEAFIKYRQ